MQLVCKRCGSIDDYRTRQNGPHIEAICNGCDRHIKFISKTRVTAITPKASVYTPPINMANGMYGSICVEDLFAGRIAQAQDGRQYVCISDLQGGPFNTGKNGKHYVGLNQWINDEPDQFGNVASLSLQQTQEERAAKVKRVYVGNLRWSQQQQQPAQPVGGYPPAPAQGFTGNPAAYQQPPQQHAPFAQPQYPQQQAPPPGNNPWAQQQAPPSNGLPF